MLTRLLHLIRHNVIALIALFVALGGTSYAALNLPAGSVGTRQLKNRSVTRSQARTRRASAASVRAWAALLGSARGGSSVHSDIRVTNISPGESSSPGVIRGFPGNCMASVTPIRETSWAASVAATSWIRDYAFQSRLGFARIDGLATERRLRCRAQMC